MELPDASCKKCEGITSAFEGTCQRKLFGPLRIHYNFPTRRPKDRPDKLAVEFKFTSNGVWQTIFIPISEHPLMFSLPMFREPGILRGEPKKADGIPHRHIFTRMWDEPPRNTELYLQVLANRYNAIGCRVTSEIDGKSLSLLLAKIAHSFSIAELGIEKFTPMLTKLILGEEDSFSYFIGGKTKSEEETNFLHDLCFDFTTFDNPSLLVVKIRLFANLGAPTYYVVAGRLP